ncbi:MAG: hypothetical protein KAR11_07750, partial [Phycisphaerae bacterium]|nr:hypothetical protein [Phycisphaerae bacterium]
FVKRFASIFACQYEIGCHTDTFNYWLSFPNQTNFFDRTMFLMPNVQAPMTIEAPSPNVQSSENIQHPTRPYFTSHGSVIAGLRFSYGMTKKFVSIRGSLPALTLGLGYWDFNGHWVFGNWSFSFYLVILSKNSVI